MTRYTGRVHGRRQLGEEVLGWRDGGPGHSGLDGWCDQMLGELTGLAEGSDLWWEGRGQGEFAANEPARGVSRGRRQRAGRVAGTQGIGWD